MLSAASDLPSSPQSLQRFSPSLETAVLNVLKMENARQEDEKGLEFPRKASSFCPRRSHLNQPFPGEIDPEEVYLQGLHQPS